MVRAVDLILIHISILILLIALSIILALPQVAIYIALFSFGAAFPLFFAPTVAYYWLCLFPIFCLRGRALPLGIIAAIFLIALAGFIPIQAERKIIFDALEKFKAASLEPSAIADKRTLEILYSERSQSRSADNLCNDTCKKLLLSGDVDWVRVKQYYPHRGPDRAFYKVLRGDDCLFVGLIERADICFLLDEDTNAVAALKIEFERKKEKYESTFQDVEIDLSTVKVTDRKKNLVYKQVSSSATIPMMPIVFAIEFESYLRSGGIEILSMSKKLNKISLVRTLNDIGFTNLTADLSAYPG